MAGKKGRSGRPPKNIDEHLLEGTYRPIRHDRFLAGEGQLKELAPLAWSKYSMEEKEIFNRFAEYLYDKEQSEAADVELLTQLVNYQYLYQQAVTAYKLDPDAVFGRKPAVTISLECAKEIRLLMAEFRITPTTRVGATKVKEEEKADPVAAFLQVVN
jgi:phage terminase small subunit